MMWVRTKLALERMPAGEILEVRLPPGEAQISVPRSAREAGHAVEGEGTTIRIRRGGPRTGTPVAQRERR